MRLLDRLSIKNKLIFIVLLVTIMILCIGFSIVIVKEIQRFRKDMVDNTNMSARLIGWSCISALVFEDKKGGQDILTRIELLPSIVNIHVYDTQGRLFAALDKETEALDNSLTDEKMPVTFQKGHLHVGQPIVYKDRRYGSIYLRVSTDLLDETIREYLTTMLLLMVALVIVTYILASRFQGLISRPILRLTALTKRVSTKADYSIRITRESNDEIGVLYKGFNNMLEQIHHRELARENAEKELKENRDQLEEQVKERTAELAVAKEEAEAANSAKSDFLARMSHEIRTPLNAVTGLTNIVLKSELTKEQRSYLDKVRTAGDNLLQVINDILDFSKVEAGRLDLDRSPFDLDHLMEKLTDLFSDHAVQKDMELIFALAPDVPRYLVGDDVRLTQVLSNLISNAIKFTQNGEIIVKAEVAEYKDNPSGQITLRLSVSDTGIGIDSDVLPTLFDPFTQDASYLTRKHEGTGLGLAICRRLVELMGGRIWAESIPGQGSTFSFEVTLEIGKADKAELRLPDSLCGLNALVVDDSFAARQAQVDMLESFNFNVTAVDNGERAIEEVKQAVADRPYQLVLLDWKMPGMDGVETARHIRALGCKVSPSTPPDQCLPSVALPIIIMVTAYGFDLVQEKVPPAVTDSMLLKPVKPSHLFNTIVDLFGQAEFMVPRRPGAQDTVVPHALAGRHVLVVEDSALNRDVVVALLEEAGLNVETAENGQIAVDKVTSLPAGHFDAVLMDIQMPEMDGYEATRRIREWEARTLTTDHRSPIIALTAHALKGEKEKCLAADMDDYLSKPVDERELHQALQKWLEPKD